ncbi:hypothetical protein NQ314_002794 [Rhamnusium bicolor]|uniref:Ig-like domain-containing protein n=1 Tax=Rhamnusium bicolor TaxID=1586634 RepID=A0AAV8ZP07_9CUCU|nr:hypothetical protein NQ314_002794 [Rhamnusium bicolor]
MDKEKLKLKTVFLEILLRDFWDKKEPIASVLPKFPTIDNSRSFKGMIEKSITLLCPAQAFPVPIFRPCYFLKSSVMFSLEPIGSVLPKFPATDNLRGFTSKGDSIVTLICPAQAYPVPTHSPKLTSGDESRVLQAKQTATLTMQCPMQAFPIPKFRIQEVFILIFLLLEPVGSVAPRLSAGTSKIQTLEGQQIASLTLLCPAQSFPVPNYSSTLPKVSSKSKYDVIDYELHSQLALLCPAQGFPVPNFRTPKLLSNAKMVWFETKTDEDIALLCQGQGFPPPIFSLVSDVKGITIEKHSGHGVSLLCQAQEPVGTRAPKLMADSKYKHVERETNTEIPIFCQAQAYPVPSFRVSQFPHSGDFFLLLLEPVGVKGPVFSNDNLISAFNRVTGQSFALLCQAQGLPVPRFRLPPKSKLDAVTGKANQDLVLPCDAQGSPLPKFRYHFQSLIGQLFNFFHLEPVGSKAPTFSSDSKGFIFEKENGKSLALLCPAQALPAPLFSLNTRVKILVLSTKFVVEPITGVAPKVKDIDVGSLKKEVPINSMLLVLIVIFIEPTGKIAPKVPGQKYDGGKIYIYSQTKTAFLTCEVVGYPVPIFRFSECLLISLKILQFTEPTNNVPPKKIGAEFGGWRVVNINQGSVAWLTCQVTGFPVPIFMKFSFSEPTSNVSPKKDLVKFEGWQVLQVPFTDTAWLTCQFSIVLEPTSNVPPKKDGKKFEGWEILLVPQNKTVWLTCLVTGYPVPRYFKTAWLT